jgi:tripartite-type tricarboxylate transporter receptor subunit TctC
MRRRQLVTTIAATMAAPAIVTSARAQAFPNKPIRIIIPYAPGGTSDILARLMQPHLQAALGQSVVVENRTGANGVIGIEAVAKSDPDGYTVLIAPDAIASNPHVYRVSYDALKDLTAVVQLSRQPIVLAAHPSLGARTLSELITHVKQQPGLRYATGSGAGSGQHMVTQWFAQLAGIELEQVPYRGGGQAINDLLAGHVKLGTLGSTPLIPHYKAGKLLLLAQTTETRSQSLPDVPTFQEAGVKGLVLDQWLGVFVPAGTPQPIVARLNAEVGKALADPAIKQNLVNSAQDPIGGSAEAFAHLVRDDFAKYQRLVRELQIKTN